MARLDILGPKGWQQPASAVLLNNDGTLVTSAELVHGSRKLVVTFADDLPRTGRLMGVDGQTGIAVINVTVSGRHAANVSGARPKLGEPTVMVGGPGPGSSVGTVTTGNVRGLGRQMEASEGTLHDLIEMDRPVLDDTVGGALVDADGEVLGICLPSKPSGLGHAVPIDLASKVGEALRKGGRVRWGKLGVKAVDLDPGRAQDLGILGAAQLVSVEPNSAAAKAGLVKGDLVTQLGITQIRSVTDLVAALERAPPRRRARHRVPARHDVAFRPRDALNELSPSSPTPSFPRPHRHSWDKGPRYAWAVVPEINSSGVTAGGARS